MQIFSRMVKFRAGVQEVIFERGGSCSQYDDQYRRIRVGLLAGGV